MSEGNEVDVLMPDREVVVAGETVSVRELRFADTVAAARDVHAVTSALLEVVKLDGMRAVDMATLDAVFATCAEQIVTLAMIATGKPREWFDTLSARDGDLLLTVFWTVNSFFFMERLVSRLASRRMPAAAEPSDGVSSSPA